MVLKNYKDKMYVESQIIRNKFDAVSFWSNPAVKLLQ